MAERKQFYCIKDCFFRNRKYTKGEGPYAFAKLTDAEKLSVDKFFEDKAPKPEPVVAEPKTLKEIQDGGGKSIRLFD